MSRDTNRRSLLLGHVQYDLLDSIDRTGGIPRRRSWLVQETGSPASTVANALEAMRARGIVACTHWGWAITAKGAEALFRCRESGRAPGVPGTGPRDYRSFHEPVGGFSRTEDAA